MTTTNSMLSMTIETAIDQHGLRAVLEAIGEVCDLKAQHVAENWQDKAQERTWTRIAGKVLALANYCKDDVVLNRD